MGRPRGFAVMTPEERKRIASKGGIAAHKKGTAHEWNSDEAREAGRIGGKNSMGGRRAILEPKEGEDAARKP